MDQWRSSRISVRARVLGWCRDKPLVALSAPRKAVWRTAGVAPGVSCLVARARWTRLSDSQDPKDYAVPRAPPVLISFLSHHHPTPSRHIQHPDKWEMMISQRAPFSMRLVLPRPSFRMDPTFPGFAWDGMIVDSCHTHHSFFFAESKE